jgi:hypothetical protein
VNLIRKKQEINQKGVSNLNKIIIEINLTTETMPHREMKYKRNSAQEEYGRCGF